MIKFESNNILVGYIKNLLTEFKLPTPSVYTYDSNKYAVEKQLYIKDDYVCQFIGGQFEKLFAFENSKIEKNYYKQLKFTGNSYDSHTHEYLGDYLRFIRDYKGLNLMSLYNCYSNSFPRNMYYESKPSNSENTGTEQNNKTKTPSFVFDTTDPSYKIIMVPVKANKVYTIALDCSISYEIACGFYDRSLITNLSSDFMEKTYKRISSSSFSSPYLYDGLVIKPEDPLYKTEVMNENNLKLFIKLPASNQSSIVVLEGSYLNCNDWSFATFEKSGTADIFKAKYNYSVINSYPEGVNSSEIDYTSLLKSKNSLLYMNTGISYPFSDRLIEYLVHNTIDITETIPENIKRMQWSLLERYKEGKKDSGLSSIGKAYGIWDKKYSVILYNLALKEGLLDSKSDILGYVDKDIENKLERYIDIKEKEGV